jgi:hypothetical protein
MRKICPAFAIIVSAVLIASTGVAHGGGWAVVALDPLPGTPVEAQPLTVGFTILQHGETPYTTVNAAILVTDATGRVERFVATPAGPPGHHTAVVTFPKAGSYRWDIVPDWFPKQSLGEITVASSTATVAPSTTAAAATPTTTAVAPTPPTTVTTTTTTITTREPVSLAVRVLFGVVTAIAVAAMLVDLQSRRRRAAV